MKDIKYYKFALWKAYFDRGFGVLGYLKYLIAILGFYSIFEGISIKYTLTGFVVYGVICFFIGWWWIRGGMADAEMEVNNRIDPFVREMRQEILNGNT